MRHDQGRFHLAERALGDIVGSLPQKFLKNFQLTRESHASLPLHGRGCNWSPTRAVCDPLPTVVAIEGRIPRLGGLHLSEGQTKKRLTGYLSLVEYNGGKEPELRKLFGRTDE